MKLPGYACIGSFIVAIVVSAAAGALVAAHAADSATAQDLPQQYKAKVESMKNKMSAIDEQLDKVIAEGKIRPDDMDLDQLIEDHVTEARRAFDQAMAQVQKAARSNGKRGSVKSLEDFDKTIKEQRDRSEKVIAKIAKISERVRKGDIKVSKEVLEDLSPEELKNFRMGLSPETDKNYKDEMKDLFKGDVSHMTDEVWLAKQQSCSPDNKIARTEDPGFLQNIFDFIVPPADAAVAAGCVGVCTASLGVLCLSCISAGGTAAAAAYAGFNHCNDSVCKCTCKRWTFGCCLCKGACWTAFLAALG